MPFNFGDEPSNSGDSASLQCSVTSGDFPLNISWLFNGTEVDESFGVSVGKMGKRLSVLNIDYVNGYHAGNYTCLASNRADSVNYTAELIVNGA